jgi:hypothetical protein
MTPRGRHTEYTGDAENTSATAAGASFWTGQPEPDPTADGGVPEGTVAADGAVTGQIDLPDDAFNDDLEQQLAVLAPRQLVTRTTLALAAVVLVVAGFLGGAYTQKHYGPQPAAATGGAPGGGFAGGGYPGGAMPSGGTGRQGQTGGRQGTDPSGAATAPTTGKVKMVDGSTVYIETADGRVVTVKTTGSTTVQSTQSSTLKDLAVGAQVSVEGADSGGTITATKITKGP